MTAKSVARVALPCIDWIGWQAITWGFLVFLRDVSGAADRSLSCPGCTRPDVHGLESVFSSGEKSSSIGSPNTAAILNASGRLGS